MSRAVLKKRSSGASLADPDLNIRRMENSREQRVQDDVPPPQPEPTREPNGHMDEEEGVTLPEVIEKNYATKKRSPIKVLNNSPVVIDDFRAKLKIHQLQTELMKKKMECDYLREEAKQLTDELKFERFMLKKKTNEAISALQEKNKEMTKENQDLKKKELETKKAIGELDKSMGNTKAMLKEAEDKMDSVEKEKLRAVADLEELRSVNRRLLAEKREAKVAEVEATHRASEAERVAQEELKKRQEAETKHEELLEQRESIKKERDEVKQVYTSLQEQLEMEEEKRKEFPSISTQTNVRTCLLCSSDREHKAGHQAGGNGSRGKPAASGNGAGRGQLPSVKAAVRRRRSSGLMQPHPPYEDITVEESAEDGMLNISIHAPWLLKHQAADPYMATPPGYYGYGYAVLPYGVDDEDLEGEEDSTVGKNDE
ncbi:PREDICTED: peripheral-type benzodiazepine receptor-associated protein 1-like [Branchiostoma belcheri]|uniref:Peripheral-type benzodiazepine receptor-associated protein 1-like n=1 Tax=Branchiostoma belcheri TaxID=7741 RepID=A0A6P4YPK5_BRABE|nr:PREDICTED: peripheral-type benzodiazepine receptor-associated protein 1-like [Branchiostoma belcheri]